MPLIFHFLGQRLHFLGSSPNDICLETDKMFFGDFNRFGGFPGYGHFGPPPHVTLYSQKPMQDKVKITKIQVLGNRVISCTEMSLKDQGML